MLGALAHFGLGALDAAEKDEMRALAMREGPHTDAERMALLDYCQSDADSLVRLLPRMLPVIDLPRALLRGRYMAAAARMEWNGVPIDTDALTAIRPNWDAIKAQLVREVDREYGVYVPTGQRLDPKTKFGVAVLAAAKEWKLDPFALADAAEFVARTEVGAITDRLQAIRAARKATGLTEARVGKLLDAGKDYLDVPGFDVQARELAGELPDLGIGIGYDPDGVDDDSAPKLWGVLCEPDHAAAEAPPRHHRPRRGAHRHRGAIHRQRAADVLPRSRWAEYLVRKRIPWPRLPSGALELSDDVFKEMGATVPG